MSDENYTAVRLRVKYFEDCVRGFSTFIFDVIFFVIIFVIFLVIF